MFSVRCGFRAARGLRIRPQAARRSASSIKIPFEKTLQSAPPFPVIETCPAPTCECRDMPDGLDIDRKTNLNGLMGAYTEQVLLCTGRDDWKSRIEDEEDATLLRQLKGFMGKGGKYSNPFHNVLLTNSSFPSSTETSTSAYLLPSFTYIPSIPSSTTDSTSAEHFLRTFLLPTTLHSAHSALPADQQAFLTREPSLQPTHFPQARPINDILILICGHGNRDSRCGILGPLLRSEFEDALGRQHIQVLRGAAPASTDSHAAPELGMQYLPTARVGLISHIGGHKFAGNVIVYVPPSMVTSPLAGMGIWYGRVGTREVEGIVRETVLGGRVVKALFRGGIGRDREILRL